MNTLYASVGFVCTTICIIITRCSDILHKNDSEKRKSLKRIFVTFAVFGLADGLWGVCAAYSTVVGETMFWIASFLFHTMATITAYLWFLFSGKFFGYENGKRGRIFEMLPLALCAYFLIRQIFSNGIFFIDENCEYHTRGLRSYLFYLQFFYYVYSLAKCMIFRHFVKSGRVKSQNLHQAKIVYFFLIIPIFTGILQLLNPDLPFYSIGFMIMATVVFDGTIVVDKNYESEIYQKVSKEVYGALESLCQSYVSVHLFDLTENKQQKVKSTPYVDYFVKDSDPGDVQIRKVMQGVTVPKFTEEVVEFVNLSTLPERMMDKDTISITFEGKNVGWCESSFVCVERDEEGKVIKVIHAVRDIDEIKRREQEFTLALTKAYRNKNAIYAEILQLQDVGVIATDKDGKLILANDMALHQFNKDSVDVEGMELLSFMSDGEFADGGGITSRIYEDVDDDANDTCEIRVLIKNEDFADEKEEHYRYILNNRSFLKLLDGTQALLYCFTDVTQSKLLEEKLRMLSEVDSLTQISNRGCGESSIEELMKNNVEGLYCLIDVNKFKTINDSYGHNAGDEVLRAVAACLKKTFRSDDVVMRLGGDEFAIYARNVMSRELAEIRLTRLFENIRRIEVEGVPSKDISISLGAVFVVKDGDTIKEDYPSIYKKADTVMYECKNRGGNNLKFYEDMK